MDAELSKSILENIGVGVYFVSQDGSITYWNKAAEQITGYTQNDVTGTCCSDNLLRHVDSAGTELCVKGCPLMDSLSDGKNRNASVYLHHKEGHRVAVNIQISPIRNTLGHVFGAVELFCKHSPSEDQLREIDNLRKQAYHDPLTDVGNRKSAEMELRTNHLTFEDSEIPYGVLFMDIDHFKQINDRYGHLVGDRILKMAAQTMKEGLRGMDMVFRWGGEEFLAILPGISLKTLETVAERLRFLVSKSWIEIDEEIIQVTVSIGGSVVSPNESATDLVARADTLMYLCKEAGRNKVLVD